MLAYDAEWEIGTGRFRCSSWINTSNGRLFGTLNELRNLQEVEKHRVFCGHNITSDLKKNVQWGANLHKDFKLVDTLLMARLLYPLLTSKGLKPLARMYGMELVDLHDVEDPQTLLTYCGKDTEAAYKLYHYLKDETLSSTCLTSPEVIAVYFDIERAFLFVELAGMKLDINFLHAEEERLNNELLKVMRHIKDPQLLTNDRLFFEALKEVYPMSMLEQYLEKTKSGLGVKADNVKMLPDPPPWLASLTTARELNQYKTLYIDNPLKYGGYINAEYRLGDTKTHRRSTSPTIQNWPGAARQAVRSRFPDGKIVSADEKNLEARIFGWQANCPQFVQDMVEQGYIGVASRCFNSTIKDKKDPNYRKVKSTVLAVTYNMKPGLYTHREWVEAGGKGLKRSWKEGQKDYDKFFNAYPEIYAEIERRKKFGLKHGYADSWCGAYLKLPMFDENLLVAKGYTDKQIQRYIEKIKNFTVNWPTQEFAAYVTGCALNDLTNAIVSEYFNGHYGMFATYCHTSRTNSSSKRISPLAIGEVHDELVTDCPKKEVPKIKAMLHAAMTEAVTLRKIAPDFPDGLLDIEYMEDTFWKKD